MLLLLPANAAAGRGRRVLAYKGRYRSVPTVESHLCWYDKTNVSAYVAEYRCDLLWEHNRGGRSYCRSAALVLHTIHRQVDTQQHIPLSRLYLLPISGLLRLLFSREFVFVSVFCLRTRTEALGRPAGYGPTEEPGGSLSLPCCSGSRRGVTHLCRFSLEILHPCTYTHTPYARITCLLKQEATQSGAR